ncbi:MAG: hypothetical protein Q8Q38_00915 [bacterium]|nr:hypothetical protein [bacterium]
MDSIDRFFVSKKFLALPILVLLGAFLFDVPLGAGLSLLLLLFGVTVLVLRRLGLLRKELLLLFILALVIHAGAALFVHYADFQPFSGGTGDYTRYQAEAEEIASRVRQGNFSLKGVGVAHAYPVIVGYAYVISAPDPFVGQMLNAWVSALAIIFLYLLVLELGAPVQWAFLVGVLASLYPSFLFFSSLLLKDVFVIALTLFGLLMVMKLIKEFSWKRFFLFYISLVVLIHFRFYIGFILMATFIISWTLFSSMEIKKRIFYVFFLTLLLGTAPQIFGYGYLGIPSIQGFANPERVEFYKEQAYAPKTTQDPGEPKLGRTGGDETSVGVGRSSSFGIGTGFESPYSFVWNSLRSLVFAFFGPFPWQLEYEKHLFLLLETIPWYFLSIMIGEGVVRSFTKNRRALSLFLFAAMAIVLLALFFSNFGIIARIRIPAMLVLLAFLPFSLTAQKIWDTMHSHLRRYGI